MGSQLNHITTNNERIVMRSEELPSQQRPQKWDRVQEWDTCYLSKRTSVSSLALPKEQGVEEGGSKEEGRRREGGEGKGGIHWEK